MAGCASAPAAPLDTTSIASQYAKLPMAFERHGETPEPHYVAHGSGYSVALEGGGARISLPTGANGDRNAISMEFLGGRRAAGKPGSQLPGRVNYLHGKDQHLWQLGLPTYQRVVYEEIYPGIDIAYYGNQGQLEFDLALQPGSDPGRIRLKLRGGRSLRLEPDGTLAIGTPAGDVRLPLPTIYQQLAGERRTVRGKYVLRAKGEVGFRVESYDRTKPLVIDPTIVYAALLGGGTAATEASSIGVDSSGNAYVAGTTAASDFPTTANAAYSRNRGSYEGYVAKIDPTGTSLLYSTYIGGTNNEQFFKIAVDPAGNAWVTGYTTSSDFPIVNGYQASLIGVQNAIVLKLSPSGNLQYSTYFGLAGSVSGQAIAVDSSGNAYVTGYTVPGSAVPITAGAYLASPPGNFDAFVAKFGSSGALVYSTYLGGTLNDFGNSIAADAGGAAYITGNTSSLSFTGAPGGGAQTVNRGSNAFVAKLNAAGNALTYFTFLGGTGNEDSNGIVVDASGNAYVAGDTTSSDFPTSAGSLQAALSVRDRHGFVAKLNSTGSAFTYSTYLGGNRSDVVFSVGIDGNGNAYVTGDTNSSSFPLVTPIQTSLPGNATALLQTTNSGASWAAFDLNIGGVASGISPDPGASGVLVATTDAGVFRTVNGGAAWTQTLSAPVGSASRSLASNGTIYVFAQGAVYRSADGGVTWGPQQTIPYSTALIVADPLTANIAYVANTASAIFKTTDGGANWNQLSTGLPNGLVFSLVASPDGSLYMDTVNNLYKSANQGATWTSPSSGLICCSKPDGLTVSLGNPSVLYRGTSTSTISISSNAGASWAPVSGSLPVVAGALAVSPTNPLVVYASAFVAAAASPIVPALYLSTDGGATWNAAATGLGIAIPNRIVVDPLTSGTAYLTAPIVAAAFVSKINPAGTALVYSTYLGGTKGSFGNGIAVYGAGDVFVAGFSYGAFPSTTTAWQGNVNNSETFVARITGATSACSYTVAPLTQAIYNPAQSVSFTVLAPSGCLWTATSNQAWATVASGASGSGTGDVFVAVPANTSGLARTATLTIAGQAATLTQAPSSCSYTLNPATPSVPAAGGPLQVTVTTDAGCSWTVVNNYQSTLTISSGGSGTGTGTVNLSVGSNKGPLGRTLSVPIGNSTLTITQFSACDVTGDGVVTVLDVQLMISEALGTASALHDLNQDGVVNIVDVQIALNAALGRGCSAL